MNIEEIDIDLIEPNREQPRLEFNETSLSELGESIKRNGIIQPIVLAKNGNSYRIIAGERRWRAAMNLGMKKLPAIVRNTVLEEELEISLVENIQREDLNPIEEASAFKKYLDKTGKTQDVLSEALGKSRSYVSNTMRLLNLPEEIVESIRLGEISSGHGRTLLSIEDDSKKIDLRDKIIKYGLSVRELEKLVIDFKKEKKKSSRKVENDIYMREIESNLSQRLGKKVSIRQGKNKGKLEIEYYGHEELESIVSMLSRQIEEA